MIGRGWPSGTFLSTYRSWAQVSLCILYPGVALLLCLCLLLPSLSTRVPRVLSQCLSSSTSMSSSLPDTVTPAQKVKILPFRSNPGTWARVPLFCFALQSAMCLSRENTQDCGDQMPCAEEPDGPGCPEGRGWGCIWAKGVEGKVEEWGKKNSSEGCWLWETPGLGRGSEGP